MYRFQLLFAFLILSLTLTGCSTNSVIVKKPDAEMTSDNSKGYVVFGRPSSFIARGASVRIMEFEPKSFMPIKLVGTLENDQKAIYPVEQGVHYFYTFVDGGINFDLRTIQKVDIKKGEIIYFNTGMKDVNGLVPVKLDKSRLSTKQSIEQMKCEPFNLAKLLFKDDTPIDEGEDLGGTQRSSDKSYISPFEYSIQCKGDKVTKVKDLYSGIKVSAFKNLDTVVPSKDNASSFMQQERYEYQEDIKNLFPIWKNKFENTPFSNRVIGFVLDNNLEENLKSFNNIEIAVDSSNPLISSKDIISFKKEAQELLLPISSKGKALKVVFDISKLDSGSQAGRYLSLTTNMMLKNTGVLDVTVNYYDQSGTRIGKIRWAVITSSGVLGGFNSMTKDILNLTKRYTENNYMKQSTHTGR